MQSKDVIIAVIFTLTTIACRKEKKSNQYNHVGKQLFTRENSWDLPQL